MLLIDWENAGSVPIKEIWAAVSAYDDSGNLLKSSSCSRYCIFAVDDEHAVQPGEIYRRPDGTGFVVLPSEGKASRAQVEIVEALGTIEVDSTKQTSGDLTQRGDAQCGAGSSSTVFSPARLELVAPQDASPTGTLA